MNPVIPSPEPPKEKEYVLHNETILEEAHHNPIEAPMQ
jgi:hypothetical protein